MWFSERQISQDIIVPMTRFAMIVIVVSVVAIVSKTRWSCASDQRVIHSGSGAISVLYPEGRDQYARTVLEYAEKDLVRIGSSLDHKPHASLKIIITASPREFSTATGNVLPDWSSAAALPDGSIVLSPLEGMQRDLGMVIAHEIVHIIINDASGNTPVPRWFHEGLAQLYSGDISIRGHVHLSWRALRGRLLTFNDIQTIFTADKSDATLAYDESMLAVGYLLDTYGSGSLSKILGLISGGASFEQAMQHVTGINSSDYENQFIDYLKKRYGKRFLFTVIPGTWTFILILAVIVYVIKRIRNRRLLREWDIVEAAENVIRFPSPPHDDRF